MNSLLHPKHGDKANSPWFEEFLVKLMEDRDRIGLTDLIREIDALMITVEPGCSVAYVSELALMTPYHYLVTLESEYSSETKSIAEFPEETLFESLERVFKGLLKNEWFEIDSDLSYLNPLLEFIQNTPKDASIIDL